MERRYARRRGRERELCTAFLRTSSYQKAANTGSLAQPAIRLTSQPASCVSRTTICPPWALLFYLELLFTWQVPSLPLSSTFMYFSFYPFPPPCYPTISLVHLIFGPFNHRHRFSVDYDRIRDASRASLRSSMEFVNERTFCEPTLATTQAPLVPSPS